MNRITLHLLIVALVIILAGSACAQNYIYFTESETTTLNEVIRFGDGESFNGPVRTNDTIQFMGSPVFTDFFISSADHAGQSLGADPRYLGPPPIFNAPELHLPVHADTLRAHALAQGFYFNQGDTMQARVRLSDHNLRISWTRIGSALDTTVFVNQPLPDQAEVFFDCPLNVLGTVSTTLILGASGRIGLEDNLIYASSDPSTGQIIPDHPEKLALVSEGEIKVLNTPQNGRENSAGLGRSQTDQNLSSIQLNGYLMALNESFTFENQNDPDSGYDFGSLDERGSIYLWGGFAEKRRGYFHRSVHGGTGYDKQFVWDTSLVHWNIGVLNLRENDIEPSSIDFGEVTIGESVHDTIRITNQFVPITLDSLSVPPPFQVAPVEDSLRWEQTMVVSFVPTTAGVFSDSVRFLIPRYGHRVVPVHGHTVPDNVDGTPALHPLSFALSAFPNPFNLSTRLSLDLPAGVTGTLGVYDVLGRRVTTLLSGSISAGTHALTFDASGITSGVYFIRFESLPYTTTRKVLLLK